MTAEDEIAEEMQTEQEIIEDWIAHGGKVQRLPDEPPVMGANPVRFSKRQKGKAALNAGDKLS